MENQLNWRFGAHPIDEDGALNDLSIIRATGDKTP